MPYGTIKVDTITFTSGSSDVSIPISGLVQNPTFTGNVTVTGTISGTVVRGNTVSGATVTGTAGQFDTLTGNTAGFTTVTGTTITGTTANFATVSGTTVTGATARFTTATGVSGVFTSQISGATITGDAFQGSNITGVSGVFTTRVSGATVTGNAIVGSTITGVSGVFTTVISGASGIIAGNITASAFIPTGSAVPTNGVYLPSANTVGIAANSSGILFATSSGVGIGTSSPSRNLDVAAGQANVGITSNTTSAGNEPTLVFTHAGNNGYVIKGGSNLQFASDSGANVRMTLTTAGSLGIGTTSPSNILHIASSSPIIRLQDTDGGRAMISCPDGHLDFEADPDQQVASSRISFRVDDSERARIDSSGRLLVGTSTADTSGNALLQVNGSIKGTVTSGTSVASTSGTSIDFTAIPSWVKRITVILDQVSTNGSSNFVLHIGDSGGVETTGYTSGFTNINPATSILTSTNGFLIDGSVGSGTSLIGTAVLVNISGNTWIHTGLFNNAGVSKISNGVKTLSATLDRIRVTTGNGTDTFDAGAINILFEG